MPIAESETSIFDQLPRRISYDLEVTKWIDATGDLARDDVNGYLMLARKLFSERKWESSYAAFGRVMEIAATYAYGKNSNECAICMECLNARVEAAIAVGAYRFAMQDAIEMKSTEPTNPLGYIREGKIYEILLEYDHAMAVYQEGLERADTKSRFYTSLKSMYLATSDLKDMAGRSARRAFSHAADPGKAADVFLKLPTEVLVHILGYIPTHQLFALQRVSKTWQQAIVCTPRLWHVLDFTQTVQAVPVSAVRSALHYSGGNVSAVLITNVVHKDANACINVLFRDDDDGVMNRDGVAATPGNANLRTLQADFCTNFFSDWRHFGSRELAGFQNLEELRVRFENSRDVVDMFALGMFPRLKVLDCYATYDLVKSYEAVTYLNAHRVSSKHLRPQPQLRVLRLGGPTKIKDLFPYIWESKSYVTTVNGIQRLLKLTPHLEEFHCINIRYGDGMLRLSVYEDTSWAQRLNLRELLPNLKVCNLDRSDLGGMPILPDTCESLYLDSNTCPRLCFRGTRGMSLDNTDAAEFRLGVRLPAAVAMDPELRHEYRNIKELFVFGLARSDRLIDRLARFDQHNLTSLNISFCKIEWSDAYHVGTSATGLSSGYASDLLCTMFPSLRKLGVAHTDLTDRALVSFQQLNDLEYIDIAGNIQISADGVTRFLTRGYKNPAGEPINADELSRSLYADAQDYHKFGCRLKTLVASYCFLGADSIESWAKLGVDVRMDLIALRDSDWLLSDVKNGYVGRQ
ncbi:hypothetical protein V1517DRAFT_323629 [Lipomyces orientalis]|uniref:Uncharacterized protein n=1 Tax=Lipomyces orientalis TaxID=1233043 RepID=A0ACC3TN42_9ASCO